MIIKLILAIAIILGLFWFISKMNRLPPEQKKKHIYKALLFGLAGILIIGTLTGRMHWLGAAFAALLPLMKIGMNTLGRVLPLWMNHTGGVASFQTEHLNVKVHIQSGTVSGDIINGPHSGRDLDDLSSSELNELESYYQDIDKKSYYLIRLKLKRGSQEQSNQAQPPSFGTPSREEALQILGLAGEPEESEIKTAHKKLINRVHPDKGGNDFLASRINQARDVLLNSKKNT